MPLPSENGVLFAANPDMRFSPGIHPGLHYPALGIRLNLSAPVAVDTLQQIGARLAAMMPVGIAKPAGTCNTAFRLFVIWMHQLQQAAGIPIHEAGRLQVRREGNSAWAGIPCLEAGAAAHGQAARWLGSVINALLLEQDTSRWQTDLPKLLDRLRATAPGQSNIRLFLSAAITKNIPFIDLGDSVFQFGHGARSHWLLSSFTESTSVISSTLARNKCHAAALMRRAGIPVPAHALVTSEEAALKIAAELGYPVVVKPANLDGGTGVAAGLMTPEAVATAYQHAAKLSNQTLIEKHVDGKDYRLVVMHDRLIWAIERQPAGVTGDGVQSIEALVHAINRERTDGRQTSLKPIALDAEAMTLLHQAGLVPGDIPAKGQYVRLHSAANIAAGGMPVSVMASVHPDNRDLAIQAARVMRLDIAGIDLLIPDVSQSWKKTGGAICEINAQPQLGSLTSSHLYGEILEALVPAGGRIPLVAVFGLPQADIAGIAETARRALHAQGMKLGTLEQGPLFRAGQALLLDRDIDAGLYFVSEDSALRDGMPFDRIDTLIIADGPEHLRTADGTEPSRHWQSMLSMLIASCQRLIITDDSRIQLQPAKDRDSTPGISRAPRSQLAQLVIASLLAQDTPVQTMPAPDHVTEDGAP